MSGEDRAHDPKRVVQPTAFDNAFSSAKRIADIKLTADAPQEKSQLDKAIDAMNEQVAKYHEQRQ